MTARPTRFWLAPASIVTPSRLGSGLVPVGSLPMRLLTTKFELVPVPLRSTPLHELKEIRFPKPVEVAVPPP